MVDQFHSADARVDWQLELHVVGAHLCLTHLDQKEKKGRSSVWVTWLPLELPHAAICGVLQGKRFRLHLPLWCDDVEE
jgi:hypothetical protein